MADDDDLESVTSTSLQAGQETRASLPPVEAEVMVEDRYIQMLRATHAAFQGMALTFDGDISLDTLPLPRDTHSARQCSLLLRLSWPASMSDPA